MKLFEKIRILRKARGLSQEQLGYSLSRVNKDGVSRQTISDWENGNFEPKLDNIRDLAEVFDVSFDALLDESIDLNDEKVLEAVLNKKPFESKKEIVKQVPAPNHNKGFIPFREFVLLTITTILIFTALSASAILVTNAITLGSFTITIVLYLIFPLATSILSGIALGLLINAIARKKYPKPSMVLLIIALSVYIFYTIMFHSLNVIAYVNEYREGTTNQGSVDPFILRIIYEHIATMVIELIEFVTMFVLAILCATKFSKLKVAN